MKTENKVRLDILPINLYTAFILITLGMFLFGPIEYRCNKFIMIVFILFFLLFINVTYRRAIDGLSRHNQAIPREISTKTLCRLIKILFCVSGFLFFSSVISKGIPSLTNFFQYMAERYTNIGTEEVVVKRDWAMWIYIYTSFATYSSVFLGTFYFKRINFKHKLYLITSMVFIFLYFALYVGTQKGIADIIIMMFSAFIIKVCIRKDRIRRKIPRKYKFILVIGVIVAMGLFCAILGGRMSLWNMSHVGNNFYYFNPDHWLVKFLPENIRNGLMMAIYYISHGFQGLCFCLEQPFKWTYGVGSMKDLSSIISNILNINIYELTYMGRVESAIGYSATMYWYTIFPWLASDFTFVGSIIVLCIYMRIYAISWYESLHYRRWQSMIMFATLNIMWLYSTASNQLFQTRSTTIFFAFSLTIWLLRKKKIKIRFK